MFSKLPYQPICFRLRLGAAHDRYGSCFGPAQRQGSSASSSAAKKGNCMSAKPATATSATKWVCISPLHAIDTGLAVRRGCPSASSRVGRNVPNTHGSAIWRSCMRAKESQRTTGRASTFAAALRTMGLNEAFAPSAYGSYSSRCSSMVAYWLPKTLSCLYHEACCRISSMKSCRSRTACASEPQMAQDNAFSMQLPLPRTVSGTTSVPYRSAECSNRSLR
mmetsp:Transcript_66715/g.184745  ORF Transcript_66715/g.184745 Transcript_66715/m.184745 type:complete len:221 (+) Transcript_66715:604-1266(+)